MVDKTDSSTLFAAVVAVLLLGVGGTWLFLSLRDPPPPSPPLAITEPQPGAAPVSATGEQVDLGQLLLFGDMAMAAGQLVKPAGTSALDFYRRVLAEEPGNPRALAGQGKIRVGLLDAAERQLNAESYRELRETLEIFDRSFPPDPRRTALDEALAQRFQARLALIDEATAASDFDLAEEVLLTVSSIPGADPDAVAIRSAALADARARAVEAAQIASEQRVAAAAARDESARQLAAAEEAAAPGPVDVLIANGQASLAADRLASPPDDNAAEYFRQALALEPGNLPARSGLRTVVQRLVGQAQAAGDEQNWTVANELLTAAGSLNVAGDLVARGREVLLGMRVAYEGAQIVPVSEFVVTKVVRPRFPPRALRNQVEGWAALDFTVAEDGSTRDIVVTATSERYANQFSAAAIDAVSQWQFRPREFMGQVISQRTQTRVMFEMVD